MLVNTLIYKTVEPVVAHQKWVIFHEDRITEFASSLSAKELVFLEQHKQFFRQLLKYIPEKENVARFLFVFNSVGFCFWAKTKEEKWSYYSSLRQMQLDGYEGLMFCFLEAYLAGKLRFDGTSLAQMNLSSLREIILDERLPLLERRVEILQELGRALVQDFHGDFLEFIQKYTTTEEFVSDLVIWFPSYMDAGIYEERQVLFLKRAQLLVYALVTCLGGTYRFDLTQLTAFADYKVPRTLVAQGLLSYSKDLIQQISNREEIACDSPAEVAIRASTIICCRMIREKTKLHLSDCDVADILWHMSQGNNEQPYHLTRTDAY